MLRVVAQNPCKRQSGIINLIFVVIFALETALKLVVMGCHEHLELCAAGSQGVGFFWEGMPPISYQSH